MLTLRTAWDRPARPPDGLTEHVLLIGLTPEAGLAGLPGHFCILLDCSQSMEGEKLEDARAACRLAVQRLKPGDLLSLITFHSSPTVRLDSQRREDLTEAALSSCLDAIEARGTTRTDLALARAQEVLVAQAAPGRVGALLLITDGHPTDAAGKALAEHGDLYEMAGRLAAAGLEVITVGLGSARNYNSGVLTSLADRGRGRFCYAPQAQELGELLQGQMRTTQATVLTDLEIALTPRVSGLQLHGFCRITPEYLPLETPDPGADGVWRLSCGTLEAETPDAETLFLAQLEAPGVFGMPSGDHPVLDVSVSALTGAGARESVPPATVGLTCSPSLRDQQAVTPEVQQLRLRWELNLRQDQLSRTRDPRRTGELLQQIDEGAGALGLDEVAQQARGQLDRLRATGQLDPDRAARTGRMLRATGRLGGTADPLKEREPMSAEHLGVGFGGGGPEETPDSPAPDAAGPALAMDLAAWEVATGREPGVKFPLDRPRLLVGRNDPPDLKVDIDLTGQELGDASMVSRRHAELSWEEGRLLIRDLGSTNGTFVNGESLPSPGRGQPGEPRELKPGDVVRLANIELRVVSR